jgi:hypothetical protein
MLMVLLTIVFDCYEDFRFKINAQWYFTEENFSSRGLTVEDAEEELGFPRAGLKSMVLLTIVTDGKRSAAPLMGAASHTFSVAG